MAGVVVTMSGDEARLFRAMAKVLEQQDKLSKKLKDTGRLSEETGRKSKDAFDKSNLSLSKMGSTLVTYAAGLATVETGVRAIKAAWELVRKEQDAGLSQLQRTQVQDRRLAQISNPEEFTRRRDQADQLASQFGVDRALVREVIFSGVSEGFEDAVPAIIAASQVVDPASAAGVAGQVPALFKGAIGSLEAVNLTLKAARNSRLDFEQIAKALPQAAEGGGVAKATAEETLAVLSVLASEFKSGETAADRMKMFATRAGISEDFAGQGIIAPLEKLMAMNEKARRDYLGDSQELNVAYVKMADNIALIKQRLAEFNQEKGAFTAGDGILAQEVAMRNNDPRSIALMNEAKARQELEATQLQVNGVIGGTAGAAALKTEQLLLRQGSFTNRLLNDMTGLGGNVARAGTTAGMSPDAAASLGFAAGDIVDSAKFGPAAPISLMYKAAQRMLSSAEKLDSAAGKLNTGNQAARAAAAGASQ